jgi:hypothetical protein
LLVEELQVVLPVPQQQLATVLLVSLVLTGLSSKMLVKAEGVEPVEWVNMAPEELPVMRLQPEDVVRITLVTRPFMAQQILQTLIQAADHKALYLEVQVGLKPLH